MDVNKIVSTNLKTIRESKKLSLDQAAKLTGVSKSMLGQIERGDTNPTISVLWKIANGLKVSFTSIIEKAASNAEIIRYEEIVPLKEDDGKYINYPIFLFDDSRDLRLIILKYYRKESFLLFLILLALRSILQFLVARYLLH